MDSWERQPRGSAQAQSTEPRLGVRFVGPGGFDQEAGSGISSPGGQTREAGPGGKSGEEAESPSGPGNSEEGTGTGPVVTRQICASGASGVVRGRDPEGDKRL